jgi:esterase/lipase superfamily enzyme
LLGTLWRECLDSLLPVLKTTGKNDLTEGRMLLINTRKRNADQTFTHARMPKGAYAVYEISEVSDGEEAQQKTLADIPTDQDTLLLIHGFNNDFDEVTAAYLDFETKVHDVGWQGQVIGFTWPSYGEWFQYFGDIEQVEYASFALINFLLDFRPLLGEQKLHVNTHSMGAYLLIRALVVYSRVDAIAEPVPGSLIVDEMTFFAADVSDETLETGEDGNLAVAEASRLTTYFSDNDRVLGISRVVHHDGRLGLTGAERPGRLPRNAFQIDCSTLIETHSAYRDTPDVMADLVQVLEGTPAQEIAERQPTGDKNTFAIGPEEEE